MVLVRLPLTLEYDNDIFTETLINLTTQNSLIQIV